MPTFQRPGPPYRFQATQTRWMPGDVYQPLQAYERMNRPSWLTMLGMAGIVVVVVCGVWL